MSNALFVRPAFNRSHRFICRDNPDGKSGPVVVAQVYGPGADETAATLAAAFAMKAALEACAERLAYLGEDGETWTRDARAALAQAAARAS